MTGEIVHWAKIPEKYLPDLQEDEMLQQLGLVIQVLARANTTVVISGMRENVVTTGDNETVVKVTRGNVDAIKAFYEWVDIHER